MGRKAVIFAVFVLSLAFAACQKNPANTKTSEMKPAQNVSPSVSAPATPGPKVKLYQGKGVVTKINLQAVSVELNHEEIKDLMPAMIMEFFAKEKSELEVLKVGDKVDFVLEDNAGAERIISIKKTVK